jgi:outer membrane protein assembly factor BamE (lipoprotein component of BamABCDE complex)
MNRPLVIGAICLTLAGCLSAAQHQADLSGADEERLTLAAVQRNVNVGMSGAEVLDSLGSPNIVSTDEERREVWVYDRVGTEYVHSESGAGLISLIGAASGSAVGGILPTASQKSGASRRSQRTLTIIVRFDHDQRVRDFSYHASRF